MRYRDCPTVEASEFVSTSPEAAWALVTDITFPVQFSSELRNVEWLGQYHCVEVGARFRGHSTHDALGDWSTECEIVEVEDKRRWVWNVLFGAEVSATWGFEVDPARGGVLLRQWARMGPGRSGLSYAIDELPDKEARIIARRLNEWKTGIEANLAGARKIFQPGSK
ncbi:SRPBCC family protein [Streptomyces chartreusis]|uniref:SRPBCC family protein n=1 Tax=Streptomyces chartreusis TaxID=1969 RepID=UPI00340C9189